MSNVPLKILIIFFSLMLWSIRAQSKRDNNKNILYKKELQVYENNMGENPKVYITKFNTLREKAITDGVLEVAVDCLYYKACCFYYMNKSDSSTVNCQKAIEEADKHNLKPIKAKALGLLALEYSRKGFTNQSFNQLEEAITLLSSKDHKNKALLYAMGVQISLYAKDTKRENKYSIHALNEAKLSSEKTRLRSTLIGKMEMELGNYSLAEKSFRELAQLSDPKNNYQNAHLNIIFGDLYFKQKKYDSAISYQMRALRSAMVMGDKHLLIQIYDDLKKSYSAENNYISYQIADQNYEELRDTLQALNVEQQQAVLDSLEKRLREAQEKREDYHTIFIGVIIGLLVIMLFFLIKYYTKFKRSSFTSEEKERIIDEKQRKINLLQKETQRDSMEDILRSAEENHPLFLNKYKNAYPAFFKKLEALNPDLTADDFKCCAMMHMNFSAKEIANYTHSSIRTIENRKYRIRKKLNIDSSTDLNKFLMNI